MTYFLRKPSETIHKDMKYKYNYFPLLLLRPLPIHVILLNAYCVSGTRFWGQRGDYDFMKLTIKWEG